MRASVAVHISSLAAPVARLVAGCRAHLRPATEVSLAVSLAVCFATSLGALAGCSEDDVGRCCMAIDGAEVEIPVAEGNQTAVRRDPSFDCDFLTCVAYPGFSAYCTQECSEPGECPEGFQCEPVLQTDPGSPVPGGITSDTKFCVREDHVCTE